MTNKGTFFIDWDKGEKYYQIHIFETPENTFWQLSSKINSKGKIEAVVRKTGSSTVLSYAKPVTPKEFNQLIQPVIKAAESAGCVHRVIDLSNCSTMMEQLELLQKMDPRFKFEVYSKEDFISARKK